MSKLIDQISVYAALLGVLLTPVVTWCVLNVTQRPDMITVVMELPTRKGYTEIYEFGPDEEMPPPYNRFAYHDTDEQYIVDVEDEPEYSYTDDDLYCMALNIYFEARTESLKGQLAVGLVTLNRVHSPYYPSNVCDVVYQHAQFSWYWDGKSDRPLYHRHWERSIIYASALLGENAKIYDFTHGSDHYHADYVNPDWRHSMIRVVKIDTHIMYRSKRSGYTGPL